jgi:uridine phosphorylase
MPINLQHHIQCGPGDIAPAVLLPGDPARADRIGQMLDGSRLVARHREYTTYTGTWNGAPVSVTSTGIGCPSTAIAVEELVRCGAKALIRVGTSGSMQPAVGPGDLVIATAAIRDEGTSPAYMPIEFPAVGDIEIAAALAAAGRSRGRTCHLGVIHSKDSFYGQKEPETMPVAHHLQSRWSAWQAGGALCSEMETSALYVISSVRGVRAGSICIVASAHDKSRRLSGDDLESGLNDLVTAALDVAADSSTTR